MKQLASILCWALLLAGARGQESQPDARPRAGRGGIPRKDDRPSRRPLLRLASEHDAVEPTIVALSQTRVMVATVEWLPERGDRLVARVIEGKEVVATTVVRDASDTGPWRSLRQIVEPAMAIGANGTIALVWHEVNSHEDGQASSVAVHGASWNGDWSAARQLSSADHCSAADVAVGASGAVFVVWEEWAEETESDLVMWRWSRSAWRSGEAPDGVWQLRAAGPQGEPALVTQGDRLWLAWVDGSAGPYDVFAQSMDSAFEQEGERWNVSASRESFDAHVALALAGDTVWVAWDTFPVDRQMNQRPSPGQPTRGPRLAAIRAGQVMQLERPDTGIALGETAQFSWSGGFPQVASDQDGRLLVVYRYWDDEGTGGPKHSYPAVVQRWTANGWSKPQVLRDSEGAPDPLAMAASGKMAWVGWHGDRREVMDASRLVGSHHPNLLQRLRERSQAYVGSYGPAQVGLTQLEIRNKQPSAFDSLKPRAQRSQPDSPGPMRGTVDRSARIVEHGEQSYHVLWGDLHRHSSVSRCSSGEEPAPPDRYRFARDQLGCDFLALTDHSGHHGPLQWWRLTKWLDYYRRPGFVTLQGFELMDPRGAHQNVIYRGRFDQLVAPPLGEWTAEQFWEQIPAGTAIAIPHTPAWAKGPMDWSRLQRGVQTTVEVYQALRGSSEFDGCYRQGATADSPGSFVQDGLQAGGQFGLIASSDHGNEMAYAVVLAEARTRASVFDALRARRTYGSTVYGLELDVTVAGGLMGESVALEMGRPVDVHVDVAGTNELAQVTVFRDGRVIRQVGGGEVSPELAVAHYLRVELEGVPTQPWELGVKLSEGRFRKPRGRPIPGEEPTGWSLDRMQRARFEISRERSLEDQGRIWLRVAQTEMVTVITPDGEITKSVAELLDEPVGGQLYGAGWSLHLAATEASQLDLRQGLGESTFTGRWSDIEADAGSHWYYVRVIQRDGEMAWSSPVFVDVPEVGERPGR